MMVRIAALIGIILYCSGWISGQHRSTRFERLTIAEGLPQNMVDCMLQDSRGFYWFGTWNGLARFDGYSFENFNDQTGGSSSLDVNFIYALAEDDFGNIWVGTSQGLFVYLYNQRRFIPKILPFENERNRGSFHSIEVGKDGKLYAGSKSGLTLLKVLNEAGDVEMERTVHLSNSSEAFPGEVVNAVLLDSFDNLWAGTDGGLVRLDQDLNVLELHLNQPGLPGTISNNVIVDLYETSSRQLWIGTEVGLNRYDRKTNSFTFTIYLPDDEQGLPHNTVMNIKEGPTGDLLVATLGGFAIMDVKTLRFRTFFHEPNRKKSLSNDFVNSLLVDNKDNIWIGTERGGVNVYSTTQNVIEQYEYEVNNSNSLSHSTINSIFEDDKNIWIGTAGGGLNRYDKRQKKYHHYMTDAGNPGALSSNFVTTIYRTSAGELLVGTWGQGINVLRGEGTSNVFFESINEVNSGLQNNFVSSIQEDVKGNLWVGSLGGLSRRMTGTQTFESVYAQERSWRVTGVGCLLIDQENNLWVGTQTGLYSFPVFDFGSDQLKTFFHQPNEPASISGDYVISLKEDIKGNIWVGTYGHGLNKIVRANGSYQITNYGSEQGISNSIIYCIEEDVNHDLWMSTDFGLIRFDPRLETANTYRKSDGLLNDQYYWSASHASPNGKLYFGGMEGMDAFYPEWIGPTGDDPEVTITDIKILDESVIPGEEYNGELVLEKNASQVSEISLSHKEKAFTIEFSAMDFLDADVITYSYILEGFDAKWNHVTPPRHFASYTNLVPGEYTFKVKAAGSLGDYSNRAREIKIKIWPPIWQTWWFRIVFVLIMVGLIIGYTKYRTYVLKHQKEELEKQVTERTEEINKQKEALSYQAIQLKNSNEALETKQHMIEGQNKKLEDQNKEILAQRDEVIELNEKLNLVSQLKLSFFTNISHEFRTPLTLIIGPLERLLGTRGLKNEVKENLEVMSRNARRLLHLINEIMEFRKIEKGKIELKVSEGSFDDFSKAIFEAFKPLAEIKKIKFDYSTDHQASLVWYDEERIENILYNLLSNAFKYTPGGGSVEMKVASMPMTDSRLKDKSSKKLDRVVSVRIVDSGTGISEENLPLIFKRFYRIESENAFKIGGSGVGLAITEELIKIHHGEIFVSSTPGEGSVFEIQFPCLKGAYKQSEIRSGMTRDLGIYENIEVLKNEILVHDEVNEKDLTRELDKNKDTVLVVEDNADLRKFIALRLMEKYNVVEAGDGEKGLEFAEKYDPDLIVSDVMMPKKDGFELCATIKNNFGTSHIPIILLTAKSSVENQIEGLQIGADDYLPKPFNFEVLEARIHNLVESRKMIKKQFATDTSSHVAKYATTSRDADFLQQAMNIVEEHLSDSDFGSMDLVNGLGISRSMLHKKLIALTNQSATEFINQIRMKKAKVLLKRKELNISEVAYSVGYNDPRYFSRLFNKKFGQSPKQFQETEISLN